MFKFLKQLFAGAPSIDIDSYMQDHHGQNNHVLIDVRTPGEFKSGHVAKAKNIPLDSISKQMKQIPKDKTVVVMCRSGSRSGMAARQLASAGYENILNLKGGIMRWQSKGHPLK